MVFKFHDTMVFKFHDTMVFKFHDTMVFKLFAFKPVSLPFFPWHVRFTLFDYKDQENLVS